MAAKHGYEARVVEGEGEDSYSSTWVLLTQDISLTSWLDETAESSRSISEKAGVGWNDAFSSLYEVLMNSDFDNAVLTLSKSNWYKSIKAEHAGLEIESVPRWWADEWTYCRTIDRSDSTYVPVEVRFRDWRLQRKQNDGWVDIDN